MNKHLCAAVEHDVIEIKSILLVGMWLLWLQRVINKIKIHYVRLARGISKMFYCASMIQQLPIFSFT